MRDKIKEFIEITKELNKLFDLIIKLLWKISTIVGLILFILSSFK